MFKRHLATMLGAAILVCSLPYASAAGNTLQERLEDLDFLVDTLDEKHPNFYTRSTPEQVQEKKHEIESGLEGLSDLDFAIELSELVAMGGDSHTSANMSWDFTQQMHFLPVAVKWFGGSWILTAAPSEYQEYIGQEVTAINGHSMDEIMQKMSAMIGYDNETHRRHSFENLVYAADILAHYGFAGADDSSVTVTVRGENASETVLDIPVLTHEEFSALDETKLALARNMRKAVPATEAANAYYKLLELDGGALYVQYNRCMEAPDLSMSDFAAAVREQLDTGKFSKLLIDLRNNGGGSDGVIQPLAYQAQQFIANGGAVYVLAGEDTFSSAVINTVMLKDIGATFVGEPTGGSVDHFGQVSSFTLPNSGIKVQHSNKFINLAQLYEAAKPYGVESFPPDIEAAQAFEDYMDGIDTPVQYILTHDPILSQTEQTANVSNARIEVNGKPVSASAYNIEGSNYYKLRDLAAAVEGTEAAFNVEWDSDNHTVTLSLGEYVPDGSELAALPAGAQTARRAKADMYASMDDGSLMPLVGRAYEIAGNHYVKLRDLCAMMGVSVGWDGQAKTITVDTTKPYLDFSQTSPDIIANP